jgi:hypothetical protein
MYVACRWRTIQEHQVTCNRMPQYYIKEREDHQPSWLGFFWFPLPLHANGGIRPKNTEQQEPLRPKYRNKLHRTVKIRGRRKFIDCKVSVVRVVTGLKCTKKKGVTLTLSTD